MLLFEQRDEVSAGVARDLFESNALAVPEVRRCEVERLRDRRPAARRAAEWIRQQHILTPRVEPLDRRWITNRKRVTRRVVLLDHLRDVHALIPAYVCRIGLPHSRSLILFQTSGIRRDTCDARAASRRLTGRREHLGATAPRLRGPVRDPGRLPAGRSSARG